MPREIPSAISSSAGHGDRTASSGSSENGIFRKEGEYWTIGYGKRAFRLKDTKGFAYLAHLLRHPGTEFHVLDLAGAFPGRKGSTGTGHSHTACPRGWRESKRAPAIT